MDIDKTPELEGGEMIVDSLQNPHPRLLAQIFSNAPRHQRLVLFHPLGCILEK